MIEKTFKVSRKTELVDGVVVSEKININDETVPMNGIPRSISFHPSKIDELIKELEKAKLYL